MVQPSSHAEDIQILAEHIQHTRLPKPRTARARRDGLSCACSEVHLSRTDNQYLRDVGISLTRLAINTILMPCLRIGNTPYVTCHGVSETAPGGRVGRL
jgi:hypothetical protein